MADAAPRRFRREGTGLEFDRVAFFSDAIYAIAMTVLVVGIGAPVVRDAMSSQDLFDELWDMKAEIISFFLSFAVLGGFWSAHHSFIARLDAVDPRLRTWNLVYLAFVAFLPFPTGILGEYTDNSGAVAFYAVSVGAISALETVVFRHAYTAGLNRKPMPAAVANYSTAASALPVFLFALSVPVAFVHPYLGMATWALSIPGQVVLGRFMPDGTTEYFE